MKDFEFTRSQIQLAATEMAFAWWRVMGSTDSGNCENYHIVGENMNIVIFLEIFASWMRILDAWVPDKREFTVLVNL
jgi:hypothetical protein